MKKLRKVMIIAIIIILTLTFMQRTISAFQYGDDIRIQKLWNTAEQDAEFIRIQNNRKLYLKYETLIQNILIIGVILSSIITTYATAKSNVKLKKYYIILAILAIVYVVIDRYLVSTYLKTAANVTGLMYVKIMLVAVGALIGIFAEGKVQKLLMSSTPAFIVIILGIIGNSMGGVLKAAFTIELFIQIILLPKYCMREAIEEEDDNSDE